MSKLSIGHKILEINRIQKPANLPAKGFSLVYIATNHITPET